MRFASIVLVASGAVACGGAPPPPLAPVEVPPTTTSAPAPASPDTSATAKPAPPTSSPSTTGATLSPETARKGRAWVDAEAKRLALLETMASRGSASRAEFNAASRDWIRACRESGMRGDELVAAAQKHLDRMNQALDLVRSQVKMGSATGADVASAEAAVAEADFFLAQAKDAR